MTQDELLKIVRNVKETKMMIAELEKQLETDENIIKAEMTARGVEEMTVDVFRVSWIKTLTNRFDTALFKLSFADMYQKFVKPVEGRRFSIT